MAKTKDYGTGIPKHEVEGLARCFLPKIQAFFESEEGQKEFAEWKAKQEQLKVEGSKPKPKSTNKSDKS